ncbi:MAG: adenylate/guanylate cyclase domain-containing protein [Hyphomicrobiales bacterium]
MERKLAAILAADVVGYTRLMGEDETGTLRRLTKLRLQVLEPLFAEYHGRVVKLMGDGMLLEFASVVDAVKCAIAWRSSVSHPAEKSSEAQPFVFRIGINLGDVIVEEGDIHGDGVNIASRLEGFAEPGGICLSDDVYRQVKGKVAAEFEDLGEQSLKNVAEPVRIYAVTRNLSQASNSSIQKLSPTPSNKPSIAVLPFDNMSGDLDQDYLADGIAEDIITGLSRFRSLFVIARNSSFAYRGVSRDVRVIGRELGVQYLLEGSVRRSANNVRISAQLIDATSGNHIWAERFDRKLASIFELQDEITSQIVGLIEPELGTAELERSKRKPIESLDAWDCYLRARWQIGKSDTKDNLNACMRLCEQAVEGDPQMAAGYVILAICHIASVAFRHTDDRDKSIERAHQAALKAVHLDTRDPEAHTALGRTYDFLGKLEDAIQQHKIALDLNPNYSNGYLFLASTYNHYNRPELALEYIASAQRLSPKDHRLWFMHMNRGFAYSLLGMHDDAVEELRAAARNTSENFWPQLGLAVVLVHAGRSDEGKSAMVAARKRESMFGSSSELVIAFSSASKRYREFLVEGALGAGLPR